VGTRIRQSFLLLSLFGSYLPIHAKHPEKGSLNRTAPEASPNKTATPLSTQDKAKFPVEEKICCRCYAATNNTNPEDDKRFKTSCGWFYHSNKCANYASLNPIPFPASIAGDAAALTKLVGTPVNPAQKDLEFVTQEQGCTTMKVRFESHGSSEVGKAFEAASFQICVDVQCKCACKDFQFEHIGCHTVPMSEKENFKKKIQASVANLKAQNKLPAGLEISMKVNQALSLMNTGGSIKDSATPYIFELYNDGKSSCEVSDRVKSCHSLIRNRVGCAYLKGDKPTEIECNNDEGRGTLRCLPESFSEIDGSFRGRWVTPEDFTKLYPDAQRSFTGNDQDQNSFLGTPREEVPLPIRNMAPGSKSFKVEMVNGENIYTSESGRRFKLSQDGKRAVILMN